MKDLSIVRLDAFDDRDRAIRSVCDLFFATAGRQNFFSESDKMDYLSRWLLVYLENFPDLCFLALDNRAEIAAYLVGCFDSRALRALVDHAPDLDAFATICSAYPAHFHINVSSSYRGRGIGRALVHAFFDACSSAGVDGVHVVTGSGAPNVSFYEACGFARVAEKPVGDARLVFLGKRILTEF